MKFIELALGAATVASVFAAPTGGETSAATTKSKRKTGFLFTGVNESGAEFGGTNLPGKLGTDYIWPLTSTIDTLSAKGLNTFRIPIMMERLVPTTLDGTLDATYLAALKTLVTYVTAKGAYAIIDPHNFGRYYSSIITDATGFEAWWKTVATEFADNDLVIFDTNNEYHDEENSNVASLNQAAINGIRAANATSQYIFVEGNSYSGAWTWVSSGTGAALADLTDPADTTGQRIIYEMHQYLDSDGSGTSTNCVSSTIGAERIVAATAWLKANGKRGVIGETAGGANTQCISAVTGMLQSLSDNSDVWTGWLWWGGGPWWGDYMYSMEPAVGNAYVGVLPSLTSFIG